MLLRSVVVFQASWFTPLLFGSHPKRGSQHQGIWIQPSTALGRILVAGSSRFNGTDWFLLARFHADGTLDAGFGSNGIVRTRFSNSFAGDKGIGVAVQIDGNVVAGYTSPGSSSFNFAVARYQGGSLTPIEQWKLTQLGNANAPDLGDTDADGLAHLAEYGLNLSPTAPSLPPPTERYIYQDGERLRVFFTRDPTRNDVTIEVQATSNLTSEWTTIATSALGGRD